MRHKLVLLMLLAFLSGCIYQTPQANLVSTKTFNSTADMYEKKIVQDSVNIEKFEFKTQYPSAHTNKAVQKFYDGCNGCLDFVSSSASAMNRYDNSLSYPFIVSISGALALKTKDAMLEEFLTKRVKNYGFEARYASSIDVTHELFSFFYDNNLSRTVLQTPGAVPFLKALVFSKAIPIVSLDRYYMFDEQALRYSDKFNEFQKVHEEIFASVVGYDENIKISDPTVEGIKGSYQDIPPEAFLEAWRSNNSRYAKFFVFFLIKTLPIINEKDAMTIIKEDLKESHKNMDSMKSDPIEAKRIINMGYATRKSLSEYLKDIDRENSLKFEALSKTFKSLADESDLEKIKKGLAGIIPIEDEIIGNLK